MIYYNLVEAFFVGISGDKQIIVSLFYPAQFLIGICSKKILRIFYKGLANWRRQSYHTDTSGVWFAFGFDQSSENILCCCTIRFKRMASLLSA